MTHLTPIAITKHAAARTSRGYSQPTGEFTADGISAAIFYEWEQDPIFFVDAIEKGADVTSRIEQGAGKGNGSRDLLHRLFLLI